MDEVWLVALCLTFLSFVIALLSLRKTDHEAKDSAKVKKQSAEPAFASAQPASRFMEMTLDDIEKSLERLEAVLAAKVETRCGERQQQNRAKVPGASGSQRIEIVEHPPVTSSTRNIMEQIEQAVQETPDHNRERSEYICVRRAPPAPRLETLPGDDAPQSRSLHSSD